ncbi:hypothetical protein LTS08_008764 [Lithohypha guttulata]|nr:hypothetical protein LTS08_008764 [Lithohypha guttulata]
MFDVSRELKHEFEENYRIRTHIDCDAEERVLVYEYLDNLLSLVKDHPELPIAARKCMLRELGLGRKDIHAKKWIRLDIKPDNVVLSRTVDKNDHRMGDVMWRSPEGPTGKGVGKPAEVFSSGLVVSGRFLSKEATGKRCSLCLYTVTGVEALHPDFEQLQKEGTEPDQVIWYKLLSVFGPLPPELVTHVNDEDWGELFTALSLVVAHEDPSARFEQWGKDVFPNLDPETKRVLSRMTNLDPKRRATMDEILEDPWWKRNENCDEN